MYVGSDIGTHTYHDKIGASTICELHFHHSEVVLDCIIATLSLCMYLYAASEDTETSCRIDWAEGL